MQEANAGKKGISSTKQVSSFVLQLIRRYWLLGIIFILGIWVRTWHFGAIPPGLNPDEASIGVESYYLYKFGMDRNGMAYPVHLISWGSGQNALYAYIIMPFVALHGLNAESIRFPMALAGILSLPLMYFAGKRMGGEKFGLLAMFFLAISPWHVVNSRWAVESNILPFIFLLGFTFFLEAERDGRWFIAAMVCFSLCLYAYGTAYVAIPVFLVIGILMALYLRKIKPLYLAIGSGVFLLLSMPIILFVLINVFKWETIMLGGITIPRLPVEARYELLAAMFSGSPGAEIKSNLATMFQLLWTQEDAFIWNYVPTFGYFYKWTFPLIAVGFFLLIKSLQDLKSQNTFGLWLLFSWLVASLMVGSVHPVNLTRLNIIFIPLIFCVVIFLVEIGKYSRYILPASVIVFSVSFVFFVRAYFGDEYYRRASEAFNAGIIPAIEYATDNTSTPLICITDKTRFVYIYALFVEKIHPSEYLDHLEWILPEFHPLDPSRTPRALGRFRFDLNDCVAYPDSIYILKLNEPVPNLVIAYKDKRFGKYVVHLPKNGP